MKKPYCNLALSFVTLDPQDIITESGGMEKKDVTGRDLYFDGDDFSA